MKTWISRIAMIALALIVGVGFGWTIRGSRPAGTDKTKEAWLFSHFSMISAQSANLQLICAGRYDAARKNSERQLYSNLKSADDIVRSGFEFGPDVPMLPNITEAVLHASLYARTNGANPNVVQEAERLYAWLRSRQPPIR